MRHRIGVVALATAASLTLAGMLTGTAAHAEDGGGPPPASEIETTAATAQSRELTFILGGREAADPVGYEPSLYDGKWFMPGKEDVRRCIIDRESHSNYRASGGGYYGAYQMSKALSDGAAWMMQAEIADEFGKKSEAFGIVQDLRKTTADKWNRYWQDRAFWTIWRKGKGSQHWGGARCS